MWIESVRAFQVCPQSLTFFSPAFFYPVSADHDDSESPFTPCEEVRDEQGTDPALQPSSLPHHLAACPHLPSQPMSREQANEGGGQQWLAIHGAVSRCCC